MSGLERRADRAAEAIGSEAPRCPECGRALPLGRVPEVLVRLPRKNPLPGSTERPPIAPQCQTCGCLIDGPAIPAAIIYE